MSTPKYQTLAKVTFAAPSKAEASVTLVAIGQQAGELAPTNATSELEKAHPGRLATLKTRGLFKGANAELYFLEDANILLVGLGDLASLTRDQLTKALKKALSYVKSWARSVALTPEEWVVANATLETEISWLTYRVLQLLVERTHLKTDSESDCALKDIVFLMARPSKALRQAVSQGEATAYGMLLARHWGDLPANVCTPAYLAKQVEKLAKGNKALSVEVWDEKVISKAGMGAFLAVAQGSNTDARLIIVRYSGADDPAEAPVALVGKGITFDSGGISLKPAAGMPDMIYDMSGAGSVLGTIFAAAKLGIKHNVIAVAACCENLPSGNAVKPGDVVTSYSGKTVEILNTDAEGRLVLADAISWVKTVKPRHIIDVATLTGACVIALGSPYSGLFSYDAALSSALRQAGERAGDEAWPMPVNEHYFQMMRSNAADIANLSIKRDAGASTAAAFLGYFADGASWAHLDVAATANIDGRDHESTGRPVPLLLRFLIDLQ